MPFRLRRAVACTVVVVVGAVTGLAGWGSVQASRELELDGLWLILGHYPFRTWNRMYKGAYNLHGHSHGALSALTRQVDVGVDVWDYRPVSLAALRARRPFTKRLTR